MEHPEIIKFRRAIKAGKVDKFRAQFFDRWRKGPKCNADPDLRAAANALWEELEASGGPKDAAPPPDAVVGQSTTRHGPRPTRSETGPRPASVLGQPFHNPYTFIPFGTKPVRQRPTPLTLDEVEPERFTGVIELTIKTLSPLLTCSPVPVDDKAEHKQYRVLSIGDDVIVPASGVRGALRSLMAVLTGGTLGYLDEEIWLCQGRDLNLGPAGEHSPPAVPRQVHLARVERPGSITRPGSLRLGQTRLIAWTNLHTKDGRSLERPRPGRKPTAYFASDEGEVTTKQDTNHPWQVKLSGRPINWRGKREGLFLPDGKVLDDVRPELWSAYQGRNAHGDHKELRSGDLVWLELKPGVNQVSDQNDIASLQWARWGRKGQRLLDLVAQKHPAMLPDAINPDGLVDEVTNLFGQVPREDLVREVFSSWEPSTDLPGPAPAFAGRLRFENLVFRDSVRSGVVKDVALAPLAPPHPGCAAFYRDEDEPTQVANGRTGLRGYKVYRNTTRRGEDAPWHYAQQPVYDPQGKPKSGHQKVNKTVDLLMQDRVGRLRIACRSLSRRELALLLLACSVDWRLGGGKPLGLGHCHVTAFRILDETGREVLQWEPVQSEPGSIPEVSRDALGDTDYIERASLWQASQRPVDHLRYPRAVIENRNKKNRGGHVWFGRHANPRKTLADDGLPDGLEVMYAAGELAARAGSENPIKIQAQVLPKFKPEAPSDDVLYGYDLFIGEGNSWVELAKNRQRYVKRIEPFDDQTHARDTDESGGHEGQSRETRSQQRSER